MDDPFIGSAVSSIGIRGDLQLHDAFCIAIQSRAMKDHLYVGLHEDAHCMVVYDRAGIADRQGRDSANNPQGDARAQDAALRRAYGFVAPTRMDGKGRIMIAPWMRSRRGVVQRTLLVGMGSHFEIWNLDQVLEDGPGDLTMLATLHLGQPSIKDIGNVSPLQLVASRGLSAHARKPRVRLQPVPALSPGFGVLAINAA